MKNKDKLINKIKSNLEKEVVADIDRIQTRTCSSEDYDGVSITVTGYVVPIRPMIESVLPFDEWRVENVGMYGDVPTENDEIDDENDKFEYGVTMFCAYVDQEFDNNIFT